MSYILDALRKAEQQRDLGQIPGLATEHEHPDPTRPRPWPWPWILAALLTVNIMLLAWFLVAPGDRDAPVISPVTLPVAPPPVTSEPTPGEPQQAERSIAAIPPAPRDQASPAELRPSAPQEEGQLPAERVPAPRIEARPLIPLPLPPIPADPTPNPGPAATSPSTADPAGLSPPAAPPSATPGPGHRQLPVYPLIADDLYARIQGRLVLNMHVYSSNADGRFVLLNMKKYNEGQRLFEGPTLERITEDGVILSLDGQQFRIRAP